MSGGQLRRVAIARVLGLKPEFIVADEPTSMLDPLVQAQILFLLKKLQTEYGISFLFISHDMEVVEWIRDKVAFMEKGKNCRFQASDTGKNFAALFLFCLFRINLLAWFTSTSF